MNKTIFVNEKKYIFCGESLELYRENLPQTLNNPQIYQFDKKYLNKVTINVANACNAKCVYCYQKQGTFGRESKLMSLETADSIIDYLVAKYKRIDKISFFGGEPLLNFEIIKYFVEKLKNKIEINKYDLTTNGVLLTDDMIEFFIKYKFYIIISIDGPKKIHNQLRIGCNHDVIIEKIKKFSNLNYSSYLTLNCTYTMLHEKSITKKQLCDYFDDLAINYVISDVITEEENIVLKNKLDEKSKIEESLKNILNFKHNKTIEGHLKTVLDALYYEIEIPFFCTDLNERYALFYDYNGNNFICENLILDNIDQATISKINSKSSIVCSKCWAKKFCKKCIATELRKNKEINEKECVDEKLYLFALEQLIKILDSDADLFQKIFEYVYEEDYMQ